jgi:HD superfamily phosphohydrolase
MCATVDSPHRSAATAHEREWLTFSVSKGQREVRDAVHGFIEPDKFELAVIDSQPFQRLRHIHQLALSYLVYPGASHKRFEHSLGVMHITGRIFDTVTREDKLTDQVRDIVPRRDSVEFLYWRSVLRMAALCHDMGHLPFSHAAEESLLPDGYDHERITHDIIYSREMETVWETMSPQPKPEHVAKVALGASTVEKLRLPLAFSAWEAILAEMISGDFGADRIDYLLRDSLHTGVAYGRFDHQRLINTLRILPTTSSPQDEGETSGDRPEAGLGIEEGGLESAEALMIARYLMFSQVYYHPTRLINDAHLKDFLVAWLPEKRFPIDVEGHLAITDNEVTVAMLEAKRDSSRPGHDPARRILDRDHFRIASSRKAGDIGERSLATRAIFDAASERYGEEHVRFGASPRQPDPPDFPVLERDGTVASSLVLSEVLARLPGSRAEYVFVDRAIRGEAERWIETEREQIITDALAKQDEASHE